MPFADERSLVVIQLGSSGVADEHSLVAGSSGVVSCFVVSCFVGIACVIRVRGSQLACVQQLLPQPA